MKGGKAVSFIENAGRGASSEEEVGRWEAGLHRGRYGVRREGGLLFWGGGGGKSGLLLCHLLCTQSPCDCDLYRAPKSSIRTVVHTGLCCDWLTNASARDCFPRV